MQAEPYFQPLMKDAAEHAQAIGDWEKFRAAAIADRVRLCV
jgi:hypothetical protein